MDLRGAKYGYCKVIKETMYFYHSDYDTGDIIRQLTEYNNVLKERATNSTLRIEAPEFAPTHGMEETEQEDIEERTKWNTVKNGVKKPTILKEEIVDGNRFSMLEEEEEHDDNAHCESNQISIEENERKNKEKK